MQFFDNDEYCLTLFGGVTDRIVSRKPVTVSCILHQNTHVLYVFVGGKSLFLDGGSKSLSCRGRDPLFRVTTGGPFNGVTQ